MPDEYESTPDPRPVEIDPAEQQAPVAPHKQGPPIAVSGEQSFGSEGHHVDDEPLPVCDYTTDDEAPCEEPATQKRWSSAAVVVAATLGAVFGGVLVAAAVAWALGLIPGVRPLTALSSGENGTSPEITIQTDQDGADVSEAVATKVVPSVVNIRIVQAGVNPFTGQNVERDSGNGSGVIIREDGYILTNNHVVEGADRILVTVGVKEVEAEIVGTDASTDLAVIKIAGSGHAAIELGESGDLKVGQYVMAVGSPFGLEKSVTVGIVSALNRSDIVEGVSDITAYTNLIQTDAAINPGNSGGALVDERGRLVGVNTLIQSTSGSSAGIGFAIPADFASDIATQIIENGRAVHPYLGVTTESVNKSLADQFDLPVDSGALIRFVQPQSPAERAGLKPGDIIVRIGEREVGSVEDMFAGIRDNKVGDEVDVEVVRGEVRRTLAATLGSDADRR